MACFSDATSWLTETFNLGYWSDRHNIKFDILTQTNIPQTKIIAQYHERLFILVSLILFLVLMIFSFILLNLFLILFLIVLTFSFIFFIICFYICICFFVFIPRFI